NELQAPSTEPANHVDSSQVLSALAKLEEIYQGAVALFYLEQCSYKEIAVILEIPIGTVKSRIARGITELKQIMLLGDSPLRRPGNDKNPAIPILQEPPERKENTLPQPDNSSKFNYRRRSYDDWDFGSTFIGQPVGV